MVVKVAGPSCRCQTGVVAKRNHSGVHTGRVQLHHVNLFTCTHSLYCYAMFHIVKSPPYLFVFSPVVQASLTSPHKDYAMFVARLEGLGREHGEKNTRA
jgi:hypothetical protein